MFETKSRADEIFNKADKKLTDMHDFLCYVYGFMSSKMTSSDLDIMENNLKGRIERGE